MIVVLVALEVERQEIRKRLLGLRTDKHPAGTYFEVGTVPGAEGGASPTVALALTGPGNAPAAVLTERAISHYQPAALLFVGVAGGLRDWLQLGEVVVATKVYAYHGGRSEEGGFRAYPQAWPIPHEIDQAARHLALGSTWPFRVHFAPIAAGEVVVNGRNVPEADRLHQFYADAVAVEMESAGTAHAGHVNRSMPTATIRGVSDHAAGKDGTDSEGWQPVAAANAATFALALAAALDHPGENRSARGRPGGPSTSGANSPIFGDGATIHGGFNNVYGRGDF